jgi:hypothetical protein
MFEFLLDCLHVGHETRKANHEFRLLLIDFIEIGGKGGQVLTQIPIGSDPDAILASNTNDRTTVVVHNDLRMEEDEIE